MKIKCYGQTFTHFLGIKYLSDNILWVNIQVQRPITLLKFDQSQSQNNMPCQTSQAYYPPTFSFMGLILFKLFGNQVHVFNFQRPEVGTCLKTHKFATICSARHHRHSTLFTSPKECSDENYDIFLTYTPNIGCECLLELPHWNNSTEYPQPMFLSRNKKMMYTPVNPNFYT